MVSASPKPSADLAYSSAEVRNDIVDAPLRVDRLLPPLRPPARLFSSMAAAEAQPGFTSRVRALYPPIEPYQTGFHRTG